MTERERKESREGRGEIVSFERERGQRGEREEMRKKKNEFLYWNPLGSKFRWLIFIFKLILFKLY